MNSNRPYTELIDQLKAADLRPTRQRLALARLLFAKGDRHVSAEQLHAEAMDAQVSVSLATVYNTLHQFHNAGLLREVLVEAGRSYFDTNVGDHHHIFDEKTGELMDIPNEAITFSRLPDAPEGKRISRIEVVVHMVDAEDQKATFSEAAE
ncbi:iron response transcriptional regulator IrrA [Kiloniella sp. b19]|uniref:iron response transcriptional regulator IrrA n=1 Tax=Kiloniella sp. GXU_MW_B19 TaxID=3141326 RepID=UPI0031D4770A